MPTLNDLQSLTAVTTPAGNDLIPIVDVSDVYAPVKKVSVNSLRGLASGDVDSSVADTHTIANRLNVAVGTTPTITLPSVAGNIREVFVLNTASGNCTLDTPGSEKILTGTADADTLVIATGKSAHLLSDGTKWYHVSNDA